MLEKLQKLIEHCYKHAEKNAKTFRDIENYRAQAFGALMFCIDSDLVDYNEVSEYWDDMWDNFFKLNENLQGRQVCPMGRPAGNVHKRSAIILYILYIDFYRKI